MKRILFISLFIMVSLSSYAQKDTSKTYEWKYSTTTDEMTNDKSYFADLYSEPSTQNNIIGDITIRSRKGESEVMFSIENAMLNIQVEGMIVNVKFDDGKVERFTGTRASSNDFKLIFIHSASKFIKELKASKKAMLQVELYNKGNDVFHFDTEGIKWEYK